MPLAGLLPVIPTPFQDGAFDADSFERLLAHMLPDVDGYTLLGSTGEAPSLRLEERMAIAEAALAKTPADKSVVVGVSHTCVQDSVALARHAQAAGASGVLCAAPYYFQNTPAGLERHLATLDAALEIDLILYDNPAATKTTLVAQDVIDWSRRLDHLSGVKLTDHDMSKVAALKDAGLSVFAGDDPIVVRHVWEGVDGAMVIAPALFPAPFRRAWDAARADRRADAMAIFGHEILPFLHVFGIGDEIATTKSLLADIGVFASGELLPPLLQVSPRRAELLRITYAQCVEATSAWEAPEGSEASAP